MYFILFLLSASICYIGSFKDDFSEEALGKAAPLLIIVVAIVVLTVALSLLKFV